MDKTSEIKFLINEFNEVKEEREIAEDEVMSCQGRMDEIVEELKEMGYTDELF